MSSFYLPNAKEGIQNVFDLKDSRKDCEYIKSLNTNRHQHFNHHLHSHSRNLNNNASYDNGITFPTSSSNQKSKSFTNYRISQKYQLSYPYSQNPIHYHHIDHCKNQLIRAQSVNAIHSHQKVNMLNQINTLLQNHTQQTINHFNPESTSIFQSSQIQQEIHNKIDRLQSYLNKIKHQRVKEKNPTNKVQPQTINTTQNSQKTHQLKEQKPCPDLPNVFKKLDKLKMQIGRVRQSAIEVQKKNSVSRDKSLKVIELEPNFARIKQEMVKLKALHSKQRQLSPPNVNQNLKLRELQRQKIGQKTEFILHKSHTNLFQNINCQNQSSCCFLQRQSQPIDSKTLKQKITFSFASKR